jgi:hypothetical protein
VRLHQEVFFAVGPSSELFSRDEKLRTLVGLDRDAKFFRKSGKRMKGVIFVRVEQVDFPYPVSPNPPGQHGGVVGTDLGIAKVMIERVKFSFLKVGGVVAHGGVKESELLLVIS